MKKTTNKEMFTVAKKGYQQNEVDDYIMKEAERNEAIHSEQRARIDQLLEEIEDLKSQLKEYKENEDKISQAIITATDNADKLTAEVKLRYAMELDRLNMFRRKWTGVYEELKDRYGFDGDALNIESVAISTRFEIEKILSRDFSLAKGEKLSPAQESFRLEAERLASLPSGVEDLKTKLLEAMKKDKVASSIHD